MGTGNNAYILGAILAFIISFSIHHAIGIAFVQGCFSWFYIIYVIFSNL